MTDDLERAIAHYRTELVADAVRPLDADELEDHLRALIAELRAAGRDADVAFAEAVRRLGQPRELAREYARVHPAFGAPLPRMRAWSASLLIVLVTVWSFWVMFVANSMAVVSLETAEWGLGIGLLAALTARRTWSRAILLGFSASAATHAAVMVWMFPAQTCWLCILVPYAGATAFLMPWRRGELSAAGWSLAALGVGFSGVALAAASPQGVVPLAAFTVGAAGVLLRARWASVVLAAAALALLSSCPPIIDWAQSTGAPVHILDVVVVLVSMLALAAAAVLAWPGARRGLGSVRWLAR